MSTLKHSNDITKGGKTWGFGSEQIPELSTVEKVKNRLSGRGEIVTSEIVRDLNTWAVLRRTKYEDGTVTTEVLEDG